LVADVEQAAHLDEMLSTASHAGAEIHRFARINKVVWGFEFGSVIISAETMGYGKPIS
jgi:hypothetical protein